MRHATYCGNRSAAVKRGIAVVRYFKCRTRHPAVRARGRRRRTCSRGRRGVPRISRRGMRTSRPARRRSSGMASARPAPRAVSIASCDQKSMPKEARDRKSETGNRKRRLVPSDLACPSVVCRQCVARKQSSHEQEPTRRLRLPLTVTVPPTRSGSCRRCRDTCRRSGVRPARPGS
jgi:hypothetical protein